MKPYYVYILSIYFDMFSQKLWQTSLPGYRFWAASILPVLYVELSYIIYPKTFFWCIAAAYVVMHLWSLVAGKLAALYWPRDQMKSVIRRTNDALNLTIQTFPE